MSHVGLAANVCVEHKESPMRTAAVIAATIIVVGIYLVVAATFGFAASWIALGGLGIAATSAVGLVATAPPRQA
jgi:hypothetical protein